MSEVGEVGEVGEVEGLRIRPGGLDDPRVVALLEEHLAEMRSITPPDSTHALDLDGLRAPGMRFWTARDGEVVVGCAALKRLDETHAELKSMRTSAARTGEGIGAALLQVVVLAARADGVRRISLETGAGEFFAPAHRLYLRHGFVDCSPFAAYRPDPLSRFLTLTL